MLKLLLSAVNKFFYGILTHVVNGSLGACRNFVILMKKMRLMTTMLKTHVNREIPFETDFLFCSYLYTGLKRSINDRSHVLMII